MRKQIHGWILSTVLAGTGSVLAQDTILPPLVISPKRDTVTIQEAVPPLPPPAPIFVGPPPAVSGGGMWFNAEFLTQWAKGANAPAIVGGPTPPVTGPTYTTAPIPTAPGFKGLLNVVGRQGALNRANAPETLAGDNLSGANYGGRFLLGAWLDAGETFGVEAGYSFLVMSHGSTISSNGSPAVSIPFTDALTGLPAGYPIAQQGVPAVSTLFVNTTPAVFVRLQTNTVSDSYAGTASIHLTGDMQGVEANGVMGLISSPGLSVALTAGFRYAQLQEHLSLTSTVFHDHQETTLGDPAVALPGPQPAVNSFVSIVNRQDDFRTRNSFYGGQVGARGEVRLAGFSVGFGVALALGDMEQSVEIAGQNYSTTTSTASPLMPFALAGIPLTVPAGPPVTSSVTGFGPTGLLAQPTNSGTYSRDVFAVIPQANLRLGYRLTENLTASLGYSFLYINNVVRPGDQVDYAINPGSVSQPAVGGGPARPFTQIRGTDFWVQGIDVGFQLRY